MKLVTFNINGIRARMPRLLEYLEREQPDIVCLQELKCADDSLPIGEIEGAGYHAVWHGQKGFNGVGILARGKQPELRRIGLPGDPDDTHSRYMEAAIGGITVGRLQPGPFSYTEIADVLGISMGTVKSRLARGREDLKKSLIRYLSIQRV